MKDKPKSARDLKLEAENARLIAETNALRTKARAMLAEDRAERKKKPTKIWVIVLFMTVVWGLYAAELHFEHRSWSSVLQAKFGLDQSWNWRNYSWISWVCMVIALSFYAYATIVSMRVKRGIKEKEKARAEWNRILAPLVDISDYADRQYLYDDLEPAGRSHLLNALLRQPKGSRSLREAVKTVDPDLLAEDA